jgi:selenophosphate synthase
MNYPLTQFSKASGCGCKIAPADLTKILSHCGTSQVDLNLLIGNSSNDDAAAYALNETDALLSTTDFFMPMVDDAYDFGCIAAANALSDIYAMGGKPIMALAILGWPLEKLPAEVAGEVMRGAKETCASAGIQIAGGHSVESPEPFFGLSVNGIAPIKPSAKKMPIFTQRVIPKHEEVTKAETPVDALRVSIYERGHIDQQYISSLLGGRDGKEVIDDLVSHLNNLSWSLNPL